MSHYAWLGHLRRRPPGFFGETLRGDPPDLWIPLQQEPMIDGDSDFLRQSPTAWLRVIGRLRPGALTASMAPRLTGVLRRWMRYDSAYPASWMPDVIRTLPRQTIAVVPAGAGVGKMKEEYGRSLQIVLAVCGLVLLVACANVAGSSPRCSPPYAAWISPMTALRTE